MDRPIWSRIELTGVSKITIIPKMPETPKEKTDWELQCEYEARRAANPGFYRKLNRYREQTRAEMRQIAASLAKEKTTHL